MSGWGYDPYDPYHVDPRHHNVDYGYPYVGYYLDQAVSKDSNETSAESTEISTENSTENSSEEPAEDQYLALFGAKELFGQLAQEGNPH